MSTEGGSVCTQCSVPGAPSQPDQAMHRPVALLIHSNQSKPPFASIDFNNDADTKLNAARDSAALEIMNRRNFIELGLAATAVTMLSNPSRKSLPTSMRRSAKRGIGITTKKGDACREKIQTGGVDWFYSWSVTPPENVPDGAIFVPMTWGRLCEDSILNIGAVLRQSRFEDLLGFNEPDQPDQSNMTVSEALADWPKLMEFDVRLGSPGCVHPDREWMNSFMRGVTQQDLRVDFVTVHSYGGLNVRALMKRLETVYQLYGRPLWITELAVGDWNAKTREENQYRPEQIVRFIEQLVPRLEKCDFVERYAWFPADQDDPALGPCAFFNADGSLTTVGKAYQSI